MSLRSLKKRIASLEKKINQLPKFCNIGIVWSDGSRQRMTSDLLFLELIGYLAADLFADGDDSGLLPAEEDENGKVIEYPPISQASKRTKTIRCIEWPKAWLWLTDDNLIQELLPPDCKIVPV